MPWREMRDALIEVLLALAIVAIVTPGLIWWAQTLSTAARIALEALL